MIRNKIGLIIVATFIIMAVFGSGQISDHVQAQENTPPGIDLIILMDQSGSMSGTKEHSATDPDKRRVYTTRYLLDYMAFDNNFVNEDRENRAVVIGFGSPGKEELMVPLTYLKSSESVEEAKQKIKADDLEYTSVVSALEMVRDVFPQKTDQEVESGKRERLIVLITDGCPYDERALTCKQYIQEVKDIYQNRLSLSEYFPLYVVGVDDISRYWNVAGPAWEEFATAAKRVKDINEVNQYIANKLCVLLNPGEKESVCRLQELGEHFIQPYAKSVAFSFFKYSEQATIQLYRADGSKVVVEDSDKQETWSEDVLDYKATVRDELYVISEPQPGCWSSEQKGEGKVDVITQVIFNDLRLTKPTAVHPIVQPLEFAFELRDEDGQYVNEDENFPISLDAVLTASDGTEQTIDVQRAKDEDGSPLPGRYVSTNIPEINLTGEYHLLLKGFVEVQGKINIQCLETAEAIKVFENEYFIPVTDAELTTISPADTWLQYFPVEGLTVGFSDEKGGLIPIPDDAPWSIELRAISPSGRQAQLPSPRLSNGVYTINRPLVFSESGEYTLSASLKGPSGNILYSSQSIMDTGVNPQLFHPGPNHPVGLAFNNILIRLLDLQGKPITPNEKYDLRIETELNWPESANRKEIVQLEETDNPGEYTLSVDWTPDTKGSYTMVVRGYLALSGEDKLAFEEPLSINVSQLPYFKVVTPDQSRSLTDNSYPLHRGLGILQLNKPMPIQVEVWQADQKVSPQKVFNDDYASLASVTISKKEDVNGTDKTIVENRSLSLSQDGEYLETKIPELNEDGIYQATFQFSGDVIGEAETEGAWQNISVTFLRRDPIWMIWLRRLVYAAALIAIAIYAGWFIWQRFLATKAEGTLVAEIVSGPDRGDELVKFYLNQKKRHKVVFRLINLPLIGLVGERKLATLKLKRLELTPERGPRDQRGVNVTAISVDGRTVANGKTYVRGGRPVRCSQSLDDKVRYSFKIE